MYEDYHRWNHTLTLDDLKNLPAKVQETVLVIINGEYYTIDFDRKGETECATASNETDTDLPW